MFTTDEINKIQNFIRISGCAFILKFCEVVVNGAEIHIDCPNLPNAAFLSRYREKIGVAAYSIGCEKVVLNMCGEILFPIFNTTKTRETMSVSTVRTQELISSYQQLLGLVLDANPDHATYVTLLPENWQWEDPIKCILTSEGVSKFSIRKPFNFHGEDVTKLYDKEDMEWQIGILMREFNKSPRDRVIIKDLEYFTYISNGEKVLQKDCSKRFKYNADFELMRISGIGLVRICHCKERVPA